MWTYQPSFHEMQIKLYIIFETPCCIYLKNFQGTFLWQCKYAAKSQNYFSRQAFVGGGGVEVGVLRRWGYEAWLPGRR